MGWVYAAMVFMFLTWLAGEICSWLNSDKEKNREDELIDFQKSFQSEDGVVLSVGIYFDCSDVVIERE